MFGGRHQGVRSSDLWGRRLQTAAPWVGGCKPSLLGWVGGDFGSAFIFKLSHAVLPRKPLGFYTEPCQHPPFMKWLKLLYVQVLIGIVLGILLGLFYPQAGSAVQPLAEIFIKAIKMLIAPIIFCTVVSGIASMGDLKRVGRVGWKALLYFEVLTTLALIIGLVVANVAQPGAGMDISASEQETSKIGEYEAKAHDSSSSTKTFLMNIVPKTFVGAFTDESVLPVLFLAILVSVALCQIRDRGEIVLELLHAVSELFFKLVVIITRVAPLAAFGAMAYTVGVEGPGTLVKLAKVLGCVYLTCALFVFVVLGSISRWCGFSLWKVLVHIKDELLLVLGTSSSETALPQLMKKLENAGCDKSVVGVVIPSGYSFNLDGTCIYLTLAALFVAQATNTPLTLWQQLGLLAVLLLTSKGAAGVTGAGFITLVATLSTIDTGIPVTGLAVLIGIDRFMSEARAITNLIGNTIATLVVAKWEGEFDPEKGAMLLK